MTKFIYDISENTKIREIARLREKALHDEASALKNAKNEGEAIGLEKARAEERAAAINKMRNLGFTNEQITAIFDGTGNI